LEEKMTEKKALEQVVGNIVEFQSILERFITALNEGGYFVHDSREAVRDVLYLMEKPWKYKFEMAEWEILGYPEAFNPNHTADLEIDTTGAKILSYFSR
jgi:hypothetical protein